MSSLDDAGLASEARARAELALASDPPLAGELEAICALLSDDARRVFWSAFAEGCGREERPAAAVLAALERAALRGG